MIKTLQSYRFEAYLFTGCLVLFGSLVFPEAPFERWISPLFLNLNIAAGFLLIAVRKRAFWYYTGLFAIGMGFYLLRMISRESMGEGVELARLGFYSVFYTIVTIEIILQVWGVRRVNRKVIFGLICGYLSLGLISFFMVFGIELAQPGSFSGLPVTTNMNELSDPLLYYAYITLMTIGYGDMVPLKPVAQKAAVLIGMAGQFYLVIITAVVVEKYIATQRKG